MRKRTIEMQRKKILKKKEAKKRIKEIKNKKRHEKESKT